MNYFQKIKMYRIFFVICAFSLLCVIVNSHTCGKLRDVPIEEFGLTKEIVDDMSEDAHNVTKNCDAYVERLRESLKNDVLPNDTLKYYYFTPENPHDPYTLTRTKGIFNTVPFDKSKPVAFGLHGYVTNARLTVDSLMGALVREITKSRIYNPIFVDYAMLNGGLMSEVIPRTNLGARQMADFLRFMMDETGTKPEQIHVIGLSLGGQVAGMVGHFLPNIGRITGLDPGVSVYDHFPKEFRLDRSDANFVDVIHTADYPLPRGWGCHKPCGHLDFYVNGGYFQPGCNSTVPIEEIPTTIEEFGARCCMHDRMGNYYIESICGDCDYIGVMCESFEKFQRGECTPSNSVTAVMGHYATKPTIDLPEDAKFFLETNDRFPFCKPLEFK